MSYLRPRLQVKLFARSRMAAAGGGPAGCRPVLAAALVATVVAGCSANPPAAGPPPAKAAPTANVKVDDAWTDAKLVQAREPGSTAVVGKGSSMQPVYGDNTMLVIRPIAYDQLRPGMTVAYLNRRGERVVHRLVVKLADGWRARGLNNDRVDDDLVTRKNLVGVIYASFNYEGEEPEPAK